MHRTDPTRPSIMFLSVLLPTFAAAVTLSPAAARRHAAALRDRGFTVLAEPIVDASLISRAAAESPRLCARSRAAKAGAISARVRGPPPTSAAAARADRGASPDTLTG